MHGGSSHFFVKAIIGAPPIPHKKDKSTAPDRFEPQSKLLERGYIGDYIGDYYNISNGDARILDDSSSYIHPTIYNI